MQRHEKVADRAGALVTERVRGLIEAAEARAESTRRNADEEATRLDGQRIEAASRIVSEIEELEDALERLRQQMRSKHAEGGSYVEEFRQIGAAPEEEEEAERGPDDIDYEDEDEDEEEEARPTATAPAAEVKESVPEPEGDSPGEDDSPGSDPSGSQGPRFSFLRRKERQEESEASPADDQEDTSGEDEPENIYSCQVCGRDFAGDEVELKSLGWMVAESGEVTCADCHNAGWLRPTE